MCVDADPELYFPSWQRLTVSICAFYLRKLCLPQGRAHVSLLSSGDFLIFVICVKNPQHPNCYLGMV
jgi:hypothetical protein